MTLTKNERKSENVVRDELRRLGYYGEENDISVEEQKSNIEPVKKLLKSASKTGGGGKGAPEFIISAPSTPDFLLIIECKADQKAHISGTCKNVLEGLSAEESEDQYIKRTQRYGVDGALHYAKRLSKEFNVIAVAVSGETKKALSFPHTFILKAQNDRNHSKPRQVRTSMNSSPGPITLSMEHSTRLSNTCGSMN